MGTGEYTRHDQEWGQSERGETPLQRLDRNWGGLPQELSVVQTGVQLLSGCALTLPFQTRFEKLTTFQQSTYLCTLVASVARFIALGHRVSGERRRIGVSAHTSQHWAVASFSRRR